MQAKPRKRTKPNKFSRIIRYVMRMCARSAHNRVPYIHDTHDARICTQCVRVYKTNKDTQIMIITIIIN